ncbi:MAG: sulfatase [Opitutaceae bacterium]|jgi:arylsulfatase A-like enzyme|nr:sulfatase [Opitutaceae bacterium]
MFTPIRTLLGSLSFALSFAICSAADRPNILWITSEDHGPEMGCYGDEFATTPHVDALAAKGLRYNFAWSTASVCAPARTALISGLYPPSTGGHNMRSKVAAPANKPAYPTHLREAGYYTTNNSKEDYNLILPADLWNESSPKAHYRNRPDGQPFFAIFNATVSHESKIRTRPHKAIHDPAKVTLPPFHPEDPAIRQDWAQYYDIVSQTDAIAGKHLAELDAAGLTEDTIIFYYGDHGSGMPSYKRNPKNRGLRVPLIVYIPEKYAHLRPADYAPGGSTDRLVGFIDLAPTALSLAGVKPPAWMHGHAFLGEHLARPQKYLFAFRGRTDERMDTVRTITDGRYVYVRNFRPEFPAGVHVSYQMVTPTTRIWFEKFKAGETNAVQSTFWLPSGAEELYDLTNDPHEINNLAANPQHAATRDRLASALFQHMEGTLDLAFLPEAEMDRLVGTESPFDWVREPGNYDFGRVQPIAGHATRGLPTLPAKIRAQLHDSDSLVRYWTLRGLTISDPSEVTRYIADFHELLDDPSVDVSVAAADLLVRHGVNADVSAGLNHLSRWVTPASSHFELMAALTVIDNLGERAVSLHQKIREFPGEDKTDLARGYIFDVPNLITHILDLKKTDARL